MNALRKALLWPVLGALVLAACGGTGTTQDRGVPVEERAIGEEPGAAQAGVEDEEAGADTLGLAGTRTFAGDPLDDPQSPLATRVMYFEFDSSELREEDRSLVEAHATYLAEHPDVSVRLAGHTDERGSREYNIALGERRADAVRQLMSLLGVTEQQVTSISYGEENPAALGHEESAWRLNRRVELDYTVH